ncbi:MAG: SRPBCC family protein [Actinomycetota bacterium]
MSAPGRYVIRAATHSDASPEAIMVAITSPGRRARWQPEIVSMEGPEPLKPGDEQEGQARMLGFRVEGKSRAVEVGPDLFEEDVLVGVRMRVTYEVRPDGDGARIDHVLEADLPRGALGSLLSVLLRWRLKRMQRMSLDGLARQAEEPSG